MPLYREILLTALKNKNFNQVFGLCSLNKEFLQFIKNKTIFLNENLTYSPTPSMRMWHIFHNTTEIPKCQECEGEVKFRRLDKGYCKTCSKKCKFGSVYKQNLKNSNLTHYGVENTFQSEEKKEKIKATNVKNLGVEYPTQSKIVRNKIKKTKLKNFGNENYNNRKKSKETCLEKYGVENQFQNEGIKEKSRQTNLIKYDTEYSSQNSEIQEKIQKKSFLKKDYVMPSGNIVKIQGYENHTLDLLLRTHHENDLIISGMEIENIIGKIWYMDDKNKKHRYFPDLYCISEKKIYETKSEYTFLKEFDVNILKMKATKKIGVDFIFNIFNTNHQLLNENEVTQKRKPE